MDCVWHDVREWGVEGKGWSDTLRYFDRLPGRAETIVRKAVWDLSRSPAGMCCRFQTDSPAIWCRWEIQSQELAKPHMPATSVSGLDLYARVGPKSWQWAGVTQPHTFPRLEEPALQGAEPVMREYALYLPLFNPVEKLEIGVAPGSTFVPVPPRREPPLVVYGTSIVHGASASRAGMTHTAILGRRLDVPVINLGFAGNGTMDLELAPLLAELDASVYVIDCLPNMNATTVSERAVPFVATLRRLKPKTPIVLVEDRSYGNAPLRPQLQEHHRRNREALQQAYRKLQEDGVTGLYYVTGEQLLGDGSELTVDGSHPTDLGFMRMADVFEPVLAPLCKAADS